MCQDGLEVNAMEYFCLRARRQEQQEYSSRVGCRTEAIGVYGSTVLASFVNARASIIKKSLWFAVSMAQEVRGQR